jgi:hypothetical protein
MSSCSLTQAISYLALVTAVALFIHAHPTLSAIIFICIFICLLSAAVIIFKPLPLHRSSHLKARNSISISNGVVYKMESTSKRGHTQVLIYDDSVDIVYNGFGSAAVRYGNGSRSSQHRHAVQKISGDIHADPGRRQDILELSPENYEKWREAVGWSDERGG